MEKIYFNYYYYREKIREIEEMSDPLSKSESVKAYLTWRLVSTIQRNISLNYKVFLI